jgi:hypothetical protein
MLKATDLIRQYPLIIKLYIKYIQYNQGVTHYYNCYTLITFYFFRE